MYVIIVLCRPDGHLRTASEPTLSDSADKFFTIDESYCPTMQNHPLVFDDICRKTIHYYIENVSLNKEEKKDFEIILF